jgi:hypothetical protein
MLQANFSGELVDIELERIEVSVDIVEQSNSHENAILRLKMHKQPIFDESSPNV